MKKTITINLADLGQAKKDLKAYQDELNQKMKEAIEEMATKTLEQLDKNYSDIRIAGEVGSLNTDKQTSDNSATISAKGENIAFIEFGTGIFYPDNHPLQNSTDGIVGRGNWGLGKGKNPPWYFTAKGRNITSPYVIPILNRQGVARSYKTYGNPANMQVYNASKWLRQNYIDIIKDKLK